MPSHLVPRVAAASILLTAVSAIGQSPARGRVLAAASFSTELQAELVAQLHTYAGPYKTLMAPAAGARKKAIQVIGIAEASADDRYLHVRSIAVQLREIGDGGQATTLYGAARGQFRLGRIAAAEACVAAAPGEASPLTVTSLDIPHISGQSEYDAAKRAIAASFPERVCAPLYPTMSIDDVGAEECVTPQPNAVPRSRTTRFTVTLSNLSARTVTVRYATADESASAGVDYTAAAGTLRIPSLSPSGTIGVALRCQPGNQGERAFTITLTDPVNGVVARRQARGVIIDSRFGR